MAAALLTFFSNILLFFFVVTSSFSMHDTFLRLSWHLCRRRQATRSNVVQLASNRHNEAHSTIETQFTYPRSDFCSSAPLTNSLYTACTIFIRETLLTVSYANGIIFSHDPTDDWTRFLVLMMLKFSLRNRPSIANVQCKQSQIFKKQAIHSHSNPGITLEPGQYWPIDSWDTPT
jgi:hypothetical protein